MHNKLAQGLTDPLCCLRLAPGAGAPPGVPGPRPPAGSPPKKPDSKEAREATFFDLLRETGVTPFSRWEKVRWGR